MKTDWQRGGLWAWWKGGEKWGLLAGVTLKSLGDMKNPRAFRAALVGAGLDGDRWVGGHQVHGRKVAAVFRATGRERPHTDGVVTAKSGVALRVLAADCVPVFVVDPVRRAVGAVHAGWRGVHQRIVEEAINVLVRRYGSRPEDLWATLGPRVRECCYEVGPEVARPFASVVGALTPLEGDRSRLNLACVLRAQLARGGVRGTRVTEAPWCTVCDDRFFSFRRDRTEGRHAAVICVQK